MDDALFHGISITLTSGCVIGIGRLLFVLGKFSQRFEALEKLVQADLQPKVNAHDMVLARMHGRGRD